MSTQHQSRTTQTEGGFTPVGYRVVHFIIRGDIFNLAKAKATVLNLSLADYVAGLMDEDTVALAELTNAGAGVRHGSD